MISLLPPSEPPLILIVDDQQTMRDELRRGLEQAGYQVEEATNGEQGLDAYHRLHPDIVLLDALMPVMDGFTCCAQLQALPNSHRAPILMITGLENRASVDRAFEAGATDLIIKPIHWAILLHQVRRLLQQMQLYRQLEATNQALERTNQELATANAALAQLVSLDSLTCLANRRCFDERLEWEWKRLTREQVPLSLILCDIDFFKGYNDTYGHQAGDVCLQRVAEALCSAVKRPADLVARYGGEEFVLVLPHTGSAGAMQIAREIQTRLKDLQLTHATSSVSPYVTLSMGVSSTIPQVDVLAVMLLEKADQALYQAKIEGRDRAILISL
jgi:diguanylate cyclase (GGDEF)-like protein